jgi:alanyl-tRNA synthetase
LERLTQVLQEKSSNYETDFFCRYFRIAESLASLTHTKRGCRIGDSDHIRCLCFAWPMVVFPPLKDVAMYCAGSCVVQPGMAWLLGFAEPFFINWWTAWWRSWGITLKSCRQGILHSLGVQAEEERFNKPSLSALQV